MLPQKVCKVAEIDNQLKRSTVLLGGIDDAFHTKTCEANRSETRSCIYGERLVRKFLRRKFKAFENFKRRFGVTKSLQYEKRQPTAALIFTMLTKRAK